MTEFDIEVECPACGALFGVSRIRQGRTENCPVCRFQVQVPGESGAWEAPGTEPVAELEEVPDATLGGERAAAVQEVAPQKAPAATPSGICLVCLQDDLRFDVTKVSPIVDELDGLITLDSRVQLVRGKGVLAEHVPTDLAQEMVARLRGVDVPAFAVDEALVPAVDRELPLVRIYDVADDALYIQTDAHGTVQGIPWPLVAGGFCTKLHVVQGGPTELRSERRVFSIGVLKPQMERTVYRAVCPRDPDIQCTLLVRSGSGNLNSLRFTEKQVRYTYLGQRQKPSCGMNFASFLTDVMRRCRQGFFPRSTRAVAAGQRVRAVSLNRESDYESYLRWVCCVMAPAE